ncbi:MAG: EamA family transporter [Magnetococcales bacterium]|nr:EamA family transporter [Magnetococcales bacterium]
MNRVQVGIGLVIAASVIEGLAQVCLKKSVLLVERKWLWLIAGVSLFVLEALLYTVALQWLPVATAYTLGALTFVATALFSWWLLREPVDQRRWLGLALIVLGCGLVAA